MGCSSTVSFSLTVLTALLQLAVMQDFGASLARLPLTTPPQLSVVGKVPAVQKHMSYSKCTLEESGLRKSP